MYIYTCICCPGLSVFSLGGLPFSAMDQKSSCLLAVFLPSPLSFFHLQNNGKNEIRLVIKIKKKERKGKESVMQYME